MPTTPEQPKWRQETEDYLADEAHRQEVLAEHIVMTRVARQKANTLRYFS